MRAIEEIQEEMKKTDLKLKELTEEMFEAMDCELEKNPMYVKLECAACQGDGYVKQDDRRIVCQQCQGKKWLWGKVFKE